MLSDAESEWNFKLDAGRHLHEGVGCILSIRCCRKSGLFADTSKLETMVWRPKDTKERAEDVNGNDNKRWHTSWMNASKITRWRRRGITNSRMFFEEESRNSYETIYDQRSKQTKKSSKDLYEDLQRLRPDMMLGRRRISPVGGLRFCEEG